MGIVPAGTTGEITRIANWRLYVNWRLRNFEKYGECEVCASEVSIDQAKLSFTRSGPYVHPDHVWIDSDPERDKKNIVERKVNFNVCDIAYVEPDPDALPDCVSQVS